MEHPVGNTVFLGGIFFVWFEGNFLVYGTLIQRVVVVVEAAWISLLGESGNQQSLFLVEEKGGSWSYVM